MNLPPIVSKKLDALLPESLKNDMTSFTFIPEDYNGKESDIVIATKHGEILEIKERKIVCSLKLDKSSNAKNIFIHRRRNYKNYSYIIQTIDDSVYIITKNHTNELILSKKYYDVAKVELEDVKSDGNINVKLWYTDDAIPVILDDEYSIESETNLDVNSDDHNEQDGLYLLLKTKLAEAKLNTASSKKAYEDKKAIRHELMNLMENKGRFDRDDTKDEDVMAQDKLKVEEIWKKIYNNQCVIGVPVLNSFTGDVTDIQLILRCESIPIFEYQVNIYTNVECNAPPYWMKVDEESLSMYKRIVCLAVFELPDFDEFSNISLNMALSYKWNEKELCIPLKDIILNIFDIVACKYDPILNVNNEFCSEDVLTVMVTSEHEELKIYTIGNEETLDLDHFFINKLNFTKISSNFNFFVHRQSPMNILHGVAVYHMDKTDHKLFNVFARNTKQFLMFVNLIYDQIPTRCVVLPPNYIPALKDGNALKNNQEMMDTIDNSECYEKRKSKIIELNSILSQQMSLVKGHLDKCMEAMSEKNMNIDSKNSDNSIQIDVLALGTNEYEKLWNSLLDNIASVKKLLKEFNQDL